MKSAKLNATIQVRYTQKDLNRLRKHAERKGLKLSQFIRMVTLEAVRR